MRRVLAIAAALGLWASAAGAASVYFDDFEAPGAVGGAGGSVSSEGYDGVNGISGSFWRNDTKSLSTTLSLSGLKAHTLMTMEFDIAFIDSWDGAIGRIYGDDFFNVLVDGVQVLLTTNFGGLAGELTDGVYGFFGFNPKYDDEAYRVSTTFAHKGSTADFSFFANGVKWQAGMDESWAIDNLRISTNAMAPVPLPGGLAALAGAVGLLAFGRGRKMPATV
ncbi:hypothetical protein [Defluviimonas sp. SAOS-178_SWC]|uniref:hypothetical protein n=1 Tax=Defluviimonas sp. SAOS-178_SWC TaxID=3121287 RepID=UPI00322207E0